MTRAKAQRRTADPVVTLTILATEVLAGDQVTSGLGGSTTTVTDRQIVRGAGGREVRIETTTLGTLTVDDGAELVVNRPGVPGGDEPAYSLELDVQLAAVLANDDSSTGALLRGLGVRVFAIEDHGAKVDDSTDDLAAWTAAIAAAGAAGGGVVTARTPGVSVVSAAIVPQSNVTFRGTPGFAVRRSTNGHLFDSNGISVSDVTWESLTMLGPVSNRPTVPTRARTTSGPGADVAIWMDGDLDTATPGAGTVRNITVRNCTVRGSTWLPIRLAGIRGVTLVTGCLFDNCMDAGFIFCEQVICANNTSLDSADNGFSISRGNRKVTCTGNTVENAAFYGIWLSGFTGSVGPEDFACTGNTVRGCGQAGIVLMDAPSYGVVVGNTVDQMGYRGPAGAPDDTTCCGIFVKGTSTSLASPTVFSTGLLIAGNTIRRAPRAGVYVTGAVAVKVTDNLILDTGTQFFADGTSAIAASFGSQNVGIYLDTPATISRSVVADNVVVDTRATPYTNWAVQPAAAAGVSISGNHLFGARNANPLPYRVKSDALGLVASGCENMPRWAASNATGITMPSGAVRFAYFTAPRNMAVSRLSLSSGTTAAGATPTLVRFGLYSVAANGDLTQLSQTASDTGVFAAAGTFYERALGSAVTLTEGQLYAVAAIVVTAAAAPSVQGALAGTGPDNALAPRLSGTVTGQTDLAASYTAGQLSTTQSIPYVRALP